MHADVSEANLLTIIWANLIYNKENVKSKYKRHCNQPKRIFLYKYIKKIKYTITNGLNNFFKKLLSYNKKKSKGRDGVQKFCLGVPQPQLFGETLPPHTQTPNQEWILFDHVCHQTCPIFYTKECLKKIVKNYER